MGFSSCVQSEAEIAVQMKGNPITPSWITRQIGPSRPRLFFAGEAAAQLHAEGCIN